MIIALLLILCCLDHTVRSFLINHDQAVLECHNRQTNVTITLVGCLHGSLSSSHDVHHALKYPYIPELVVLELCPSRYTSLLERRSAKVNGNVSRPRKARSSENDRTHRFAASLLGGVSSLQASLSGFEPGLEFIRAMDFVDNQNESMGESKKVIDIILADQSVDETLARLDSLPKVSFDMFQDFYSHQFRWSNSIYQEQTKALFQAVCGPLELSKVLTRNYQAFIDLIKLTLPPIICLQALVILAAAFLGYQPSSGGINVETQFDVLQHLMLTATFMFISYLFIVLPLFKIVIFERDDQIASGIASSCKLIEERANTNEGDAPSRVVAVLGLLHVNGVAKRLETLTEKIL